MGNRIDGQLHPSYMSRWKTLIVVTTLAIGFSTGSRVHSGEPLSSSASSQTTQAVTSNSYEYGRPSRDGIGKFYLGREISHVMGHLGAGWLERPGRQREERTDLLIKGLPLERDSVVADIGAGTGYFTFPVAARVPDGRVYAVDIQPEMLEIVRERIAESGVNNVETILGSVQSPELPAGQIDLAFIVDAYHEFSHPREMGESLKAALKPGGYLVLIEYRAEDITVPIKTLHKMSEAQAKREMAEIGMRWVRTDTYLPQQHVLIFRKS
ncbi:MAG: class I SAM-dependent methyltransferase [Pseudomonadota bacterium]